MKREGWNSWKAMVLGLGTHWWAKQVVWYRYRYREMALDSTSCSRSASSASPSAKNIQFLNPFNCCLRNSSDLFSSPCFGQLAGHCHEPPWCSPRDQLQRRGSASSTRRSCRQLPPHCWAPRHRTTFTLSAHGAGNSPGKKRTCLGHCARPCIPLLRVV